MISKPFSEHPAEDILDIERARLADLQDAHARRIPYRYRVPGLTALAPRHQAALLREAEKAVVARFSFKAWALAWVASAASLVYFFMAAERYFLIILIAAPVLGVVRLHTEFVRRELRLRVASTES